MRRVLRSERDGTRERERDACYETTARESLERRGEERRGEPVGRAFCASGRSFSILPPPTPCSPSLFSFSIALILPRSFLRAVSLSLYPSRPLSRVSTVSPPSPSLLLSSLLFSPFLPPATLPWNPFDFPLSSRRSPQAKIKREGGGGGEGGRE